MTKEEVVNILDEYTTAGTHTLGTLDIEAFKLASEWLKQTTWVCVSDRLPKNYEKVLVCGNSLIVAAQYIDGVFETSNDNLYGIVGNQLLPGAKSFDVVAWMPLPQIHPLAMDVEGDAV